ncbi:hypothetical protein HRI_000762600 [Hibiscus trionum]|uniref:Uncharacterized protein n=1 Tax=Hibiscus trionum TaxID=183268 RepID=A0A9W7H595_HIBTR|nr:hypothetical protein HRI_000762600 [Hibiscus trionum]
MAVSRGMVVLWFITLVACSFLVKSSNANHNKGEGCHHDHHPRGHGSQQCKDTPEDEDDFDDTFKIVDNVKISI